MKKRSVLVLTIAAMFILLFALPVSADNPYDIEIAHGYNTVGINDGEYLLTDSDDGTIINGTPSHYNIHYDAGKNLLILKDATILSNQWYGINIYKDMNIQFSGLNSIQLAEQTNGSLFGIFSEGKLTFSGTNLLSVYVRKTAATYDTDKVNSFGIYANGDITFNDSVNKANPQDHGSYSVICEGIQYANNNCHTVGVCSDGGSVYVNGGNYYNISTGKTGYGYGIGIDAETDKISGKGGNIFIRNTKSLSINTNNETKIAYGMTAKGYIQIESGTVSVDCYGKDAIHALNNVNITGGIVKAHGKECGIYSEYGNVVITGGSHMIKGEQRALYNQSDNDPVFIGKNMSVLAGENDAILKTISFNQYTNEKVCRISPFTDLKADWYKLPVFWASVQEITTGTDATHFSPDKICTRAEIVTLLYRTLEVKENSGKNPFVDVKKGSYYFNAVCWANDKGITKGTDSTHFSPDKPCTRAEVATLLYRYIDNKVTATNPFKDVAKSSYYYDAVMWMIKENITTGTDATHFSPDTPCTRAEIITFLYRAMN